MHQQKVYLRYMGEMAVALILYAVVLVVSIVVGRPMAEGVGRTMLLLSPMAPILLMVAAGVRGFRRVDEYLRLKILENWAMTAVITAVVTFTYGFLENVGMPKLSMFAVWPLMGTISVLFGLIRRMMER